MQKVLFIIPNLTNGGIQTQVVLLARHFKDKLNMEVSIWGVYTADEDFTRYLREDGFKIEMRPEFQTFFSKDYWALSKLKKLNEWFKLIKTIRKKKFDILLPYTKQISFITNIVWNFTHAKICFRFERGGHANPKTSIPTRFNVYHFLARHPLPIYVANSAHGREALSIMDSVPIEKIHIIRNAFIPKPALNIEEQWEGILEANPDRIVITMVANFFGEKDHETVLKAWAEIDNKHKAILIFAGLGGAAECAINQRKAIDLAHALQIEEKVYFAGSVQNTTKLLNKTDIGLLSTRSEGCPNAILEYMGASLPIIATDIPGIREIISINNAEYLFSVGDVSILKVFLNQLISSRSKRRELGEQNYKHVIEKFAPEIMFKKYEEILLAKKLL